MALRCAHFKLTDFIRNDESYHFAQTVLTAENGVRFHDHDYHEVFWVTRGRGEHHLNGQTSALLPGAIYLIHPTDRHRVVGTTQSPMQIVNLAFPSDSWRAVRQRYFSAGVDWFELPEEDRAWSMDSRNQASLKHWTERLAAAERPRVVLDGFLMELPNLRSRGESSRDDPAPDWLLHAQREIVRPENFSGGTLAFARLAGRSPSHVSRTTFKWLGTTPTELVNEARIDYSAKQLTETNRPIIEIMFDCGLTNLSHFYTLFRNRFGVSPRRYRLTAHPTVRG